MQNIHKSRIIFCFAISLIVTSFISSEAVEVLRLSTGSQTGVYYPIGLGISQIAKKADIDITVLKSEGSVENLEWLRDGKADLCIAQSDIVYYAYNGLGKFREKIANINIISSLYTEAVHILIRNPLYIKNIADFRGKRISIGPPGSGTESNARAILEALGITESEFILLNLNFEDSITALKENKVDVVFITSGVPSDAVKKMLALNIGYLFEIKSDIVQRLIDVEPFFIVTTIPAGTYNHQDEEITTIGVSALLVGRTDLDDALVYNLTKLIFTQSKGIAQFHEKGKDISLKSALKGATIPIAHGANRFFKEEGLYRREIYKKVLNYLFILLLIMALIVAVIQRRKIGFFLRTKELIRVFALLFLTWILGSYFLYFFEHKLNENYSTVLISFWSGLVNLIQFGSKEPFTPTGRTISIVMMVLGVGGIAWFTGEVASIFVHRKLMGGKRRMEKMKNHYVIANWNNKGYGIIEQLHSSDLELKRPIIIIAESTESINLPEKMEYDDVYIVKGNPANEAILKRANAQNAHAMIILAKDIENGIADAESILIILSLRKICADAKVKHIPVIAEILNPQKVNLAAYAGVEGDGSIEIISSHFLGQKLLAQAAVSPGVSKVYEDLLTFDKIGGEIYKCTVPQHMIGRSFHDLLSFANELRQKNINIIPIAIYRGDNLFINPSREEINSLADSDSLFVIASNQRDLKNLEI